MLEKIPSVIGQALQGIRPGLDAVVAHKNFPDVPETVAVESSAFGHGGTMPVDTTADGRKVSPPIRWSNVPSGTAEIVLVIEDADSPTPHPLVHVLAFALPPTGELPEGALASDGSPGQGVALGQNSFGHAAYLPPDPPSGHGPHRYVIQVFALGRASGLTGTPGRTAVIEALAGKVSAKGVLIGTFERS